MCHLCRASKWWRFSTASAPRLPASATTTLVCFCAVAQPPAAGAGGAVPAALATGAALGGVQPSGGSQHVLLPVESLLAPPDSQSFAPCADYGLESFEQRAAECTFPWLMANVLDAESGKPLGGARPTLLLDWQGVRVGLVGERSGGMSVPDGGLDGATSAAAPVAPLPHQAALLG